MNIIKSTGLALALACGATGAANALQVTNLAFNGMGTPTSFNLDFSWDGTPYNETAEINIAFDFDFSFVSYSGTGNQQTGYIVDQGANRLTTSSTACNSSANALIGNGAGCDLVNASTTPGVLFSGLNAGTYTFGVFDSLTPTTGSVVFNVTQTVAPVPLPATGALLLGALGLLGWRARRKAA